MASEKSLETLTKLVSLLKTRGFIDQAPAKRKDAKQAVNYMFGPAGVLLKRNILQTWWNWMVTTQVNTYPVESGLITGVKQDSQSSEVCSVRKSLSKDCFRHFALVCGLVNHKLPFSIVQTGSCFAASASAWSGKFLFDSNIHTSLISQYYCGPTDTTKSFDHWMRYRLQWWRQFAGNPSNFTATEMQVQEDGTARAFIQFEFPWGLDNVEAIVNKGDNPLKQLQKDEVDVMCKSGRKQVIPHIIECTAVLERGLMAYLYDVFTEKQKFSLKKKEDKGSSRLILQLNKSLAPYKVAIATSGSKVREVKEIASHLNQELKHAGMETLDLNDDSHSLENQIIRNDEMGVPYTVIVNDNTLETGIVNCRDRDTTLKEQLHITQLKDSILKLINSR